MKKYEIKAWISDILNVFVDGEFEGNLEETESTGIFDGIKVTLILKKEEE